MDIFTGHPDWTMEILEDGTFGVLEYQCWHLSEVVLPETVSSIQREAFFNCYRLKKINILADCKVEDDAFLNCDFIEHGIPIDKRK